MMKNLFLIKTLNSFLNPKQSIFLIRTLKQMQPETNIQHQPLDDFDHDYRIPFTDAKKWKQYLSDNGFVVVKNFLPKETCQKYMDQVWDMMEKLSLGKIKRNDVETQKVQANYPSAHHGGLMQYIGHAQFQWELRKLAKPIFEELWQDKDLRCSFDGVNFSNGLYKFGFAPQNQGLHVDQPPIKKGVWSYQGIMALTNAGTDGGGFVCVPKSHLYFSEYYKEKHMQARVIAHRIPPQDIYKQPLCNYIKVNCEAGDFTIFDSRTFHCGCPPRNQNLRVVTYICMMPSKMIPEKKAEQRRQAFKDRMNSGHHCGDGFRTFAKIPRKAPKDQQEFAQFAKAIADLNQVGKQDLQNDKEIMELV